MQTAMEKQPTPNQKDSTTMGAVGRVTLQVVRNQGVSLVLLILVLIYTAIVAPQFFNGDNLLNVARQTSVTGIVAVGMTFVILTAGIDLSVGSILALVAVAFAMLLQRNVPVPLSILLGLGIGGAVGLVNGIGTTFLRIQPFIMTLAMLAIANGLALVISDGGTEIFTTTSPILDALGNGNLLGLPGPFVIFIASAAVAWVVLRYLPFGRFVYAIGGSSEAAHLSGIKRNRVLIGVYIISGLCAGLAGVMTASRLTVGEPTAGGLVNLDAIAAVVIGGTSLMGGRGSVVGTVAGAFLLAMVSNVLNLTGVNPYNQQVVKGLIIILAVLLTSQEIRQEVQQRLKLLRRGGQV